MTPLDAAPVAENTSLILASEAPTSRRRFLEFFTVQICNRNTLRSYAKAVFEF